MSIKPYKPFIAFYKLRVSAWYFHILCRLRAEMAKTTVWVTFELS